MPTRLAKPRKKCPISGEPLVIAELSNGVMDEQRYQVRGLGWVGTKIFPTYETAEWWVSHNGGEPPKFQNPYKRISVTRDENDPIIDEERKEMVADENEVNGQVEGIADAFAKGDI